MITENLSTLKIHKLTKAQYERELAAGNIDANALYLTPKADKEHVHMVVDIADLSATATELNYMDGVTSNVQTQLDSKANAADIATTASLGISNSDATYVKIADFGNWGTGEWYQKGFSMLIASRAGEMVWVAISSDDSNTNAKAIRLLNTYSKIAAIYYSASESAIYVRANAWCNNICAHLISNINGDYVPTVTNVGTSGLASDAVEIAITEFGASSSTTNVGDSSRTLSMTGSGGRPMYNGGEVALKSDVDNIQNQLDGIAASAIAVLSGTAEPTAEMGDDGDIYLVMG